MNRHEDMCSDATCPRCEPLAYAEYIEKHHQHMIQSLKPFTDSELQWELTRRNQDRYKSRVNYLDEQINKLVEEKKEYEIKLSQLEN